MVEDKEQCIPSMEFDDDIQEVNFLNTPTKLRTIFSKINCPNLKEAEMIGADFQDTKNFEDT
jgi:hypothetical protein